MDLLSVFAYKSTQKKELSESAVSSEEESVRRLGVKESKSDVENEVSSTSASSEEESVRRLGVKESKSDVENEVSSTSTTSAGSPVVELEATQSKKIPTSFSAPIRLPFHIGSTCKVLSLGSLTRDNSYYHDTKYLWPVGFFSVKKYTSYVDISKKIWYRQGIQSGGSSGPKFVVTPGDDSINPISAKSATKAWSIVLDRINSKRRSMSESTTGTAISGPEFFGYTNPSIAEALECLPGMDQCRTYIKLVDRAGSLSKGKTRKRSRRRFSKNREISGRNRSDNDELCVYVCVCICVYVYMCMYMCTGMPVCVYCVCSVCTYHV